MQASRTIQEKAAAVELQGRQQQMREEQAKDDANVCSQPLTTVYTQALSWGAEICACWQLRAQVLELRGELLHLQQQLDSTTEALSASQQTVQVCAMQQRVRLHCAPRIACQA